MTMQHSNPRGNDLDIAPRGSSPIEIRLTARVRATHLHVVGNSGSGKTKFLENLIRQDVIEWRRSKCGMLLLDPHGNLFNNILAWMARSNLDRPVVLIDLTRRDWVVSYNVLRGRSAAASVVVDAMTSAMAHVWGAEDLKATPLFARWASNVLRALYEKRMTIETLLSLTPPILTQVWLTTLEEIIANPLGPIWTRPIDCRHAAGSVILLSKSRDDLGVPKHSLFDE